MPQTPGCYWLYYFDAEAIDAAAERVTQGRQDRQRPDGSSRRLVDRPGLDPQGAFFALVAPKR